MKKDIKNKKISPFYNNLQHFVQNLKIYLYPYLKKKKRKKKDKQSCSIKLKYFRSGIIHRSSRNRLPRWGNKELRNAVSMRESSERLTSQAETNSRTEFGSNPHQHPRKLRHSIHRDRRWTDARILAPDFLIFLPSTRDSSTPLRFPIGETPRSIKRPPERARIIFRINSP